MKAKERHRLKENELAHSLAIARGYVEPRRRQVTAALILAVLLVIGITAFFIIREQTQARGSELLADAMVALNAQVVPPAPKPESGAEPPAFATQAGTFPTEQAKLQAALPKLKAAADAYPDSRAGITARYHLGASLAALGRHQEAIQAFDEVIRRAGNDVYGRMARLGKAEAQVQAKQHDAAITTYKELAGNKDGDLPVDAILMELARAYVAAGKTEEARKTFTQIVDEHPESPYAADARKERDQLKG
jgi:TolA-binding protein